MPPKRAKMPETPRSEALGALVNYYATMTERQPTETERFYLKKLLNYYTTVDMLFIAEDVKQ